MAAFSLRGYWRTLRVRIAWRPAMTMTRFTTTAMTGRRTKSSVSFMEGARADDGVPGREARGHRHVVASPLSQAHELLPRHLGGPSRAVLLVLDGEHRVAVGREDDRGGGDEQHRLPLRGEDVHVREHPGAQAPVLVPEGGPHAHVARGDVHLGVDGADLAFPAGAGVGVGPHAHR